MNAIRKSDTGHIQEVIVRWAECTLPTYNPHKVEALKNEGVFLFSTALLCIEIETVYFYSHHMKLTGLDFRT